jgi:hypothetical protein
LVLVVVILNICDFSNHHNNELTSVHFSC